MVLGTLVALGNAAAKGVSFPDDPSTQTGPSRVCGKPVGSQVPLLPSVVRPAGKSRRTSLDALPARYVPEALFVTRERTAAGPGPRTAPRQTTTRSGRSPPNF